MSYLMEIKDDVQKFARVIESILKVDVTIVDDNLKRVAGTGKYENLMENSISTDSVFAKALNTGNSYFVESPRISDLCDMCSSKNDCIEDAEVCCPIIFENFKIGVIGLIAFGKEKKNSLLSQKENLQEFLNQMANLISSKVHEKEVLTRNKILRRQLETIIDTIDEGIMAVDRTGTITHCNFSVRKIMKINFEEVVGMNISSIFPEFELCNNEYENVNNKEFVVKKDKSIIRGLLNTKTIIYNNRCVGTVFIIREISDIRKVINNVSGANSYVSFEDIIGKSKAIMDIKEKAKKAAIGTSSVLIMGESGTGKEMFARSIHNASDRRGKPFVAINCAAIPESLLESELFGYEDGAFTGAKKGGKIGKFELANGGTIFLDEIGDMQLHMQAKLLRVLQDRTIERVGGQYGIPFDVRVISATHKDLYKMMQYGEFRYDLFYRLNVIPLFLPPLRDRKEDIIPAMEYMLDKCNSKLHKSILDFKDDVYKIFLNYSWHGNMRELENTVEYAVNMETGTYITVNSIPAKFKQTQYEIESRDITPIKDLEKEAMVNALNIYGYKNKDKAAKSLGMSRATFYRKLKEYNIFSI